MGAGYDEYGQKHRFRVIRDLAVGRRGDVIELGANHSNCILKDSIKIDIKDNSDIQADINNGIPLDTGSVETIVACEIIEHLSNPFFFLKEIKRVLKKGGVLIITTPNLCSLKNRLLVFLGRFPNNAAQADFYRYWVDDNDIPQLAHYSDYTFPTLERALIKEGFRVLERRTNGIFFRGRNMLPPRITPYKLGEQIIIKAML